MGGGLARAGVSGYGFGCKCAPVISYVWEYLGRFMWSWDVQEGSRGERVKLKRPKEFGARQRCERVKQNSRNDLWEIDQQRSSNRVAHSPSQPSRLRSSRREDRGWGPRKQRHGVAGRIIAVRYGRPRSRLRTFGTDLGD